MNSAKARTYARLVNVAVHLPDTRRSTTEVEDRVRAHNPGFEPPRGLLERFTGVGYRHVAPDDWAASDLAVAATKKLFAGCDRAIDDIDLIIFAAASFDVLEPATAHIVADKLGASCPVFDVKNACNSVLNAIEIADTLIRGGRYERILIACGERISPAAQWDVATLADYVAAGASHTVSDAGAALLLESSTAPGILAHRFAAQSGAWSATALPFESGRFRVKSLELLTALDSADISVITDTVADLGLTMRDFAAVCVHQAALPYLRNFCHRAGIPIGKTVITIVDHGNVASASLPLQLVCGAKSGKIRRGDLVALIGLASGLSLGIAVLRW